MILKIETHPRKHNLTHEIELVEEKNEKKGWLVSLSHKLISMADDPEQQRSNRASIAQQFLKAASFSHHSPGNKKVTIVFSNKGTELGGTQQARKFKKSRQKNLLKSNKSKNFFVKLHFW